MAQFSQNKVLILLFISFNLLELAFSQLFCQTNGQNIQRTSNTLLLLYSVPVGNFDQDYDKMFSITKDTNTSLKATSDFFASLTITSCAFKSGELESGDTSTLNSGLITCTQSGNTLEMSPWDRTKGTIYNSILIEVTFSTNVSTKTPKTYQVDHELKLGATFNANTLLKCQHSVVILSSRSSTLKMAITAANVPVESQNPISFKFTPLLDNTSDELLVLITRISYARDFTDVFSLWNTSTLTLSPATGITLRNNGTDFCTDTTYFCLSLVLNTAFVFKSGTEYELKIINFIYPFHPLGIQDAQIRLRFTKSEYERNSLISSPSSQITSAQFTPKTETASIINIQYCTTQSNCSQIGNIGAQYNKIIITVANPSLLIINTQLEVIFSMDYFKFDPADSKAATINFTKSATSTPGTFSYNLPSSNQMKASFNIPSIQYISDNNVQIEITKPIMGLDSNVKYLFQFNSFSRANINGQDVSAQQFQMSYTNLVLTANTFKILQIDDSTPLQIGSSQEYKFKITPLYSFTTNQMWVKITFPTPSYSLDASNSNCYKVTLNGGQQISSSSISEITRLSGVVRFKTVFSTSTLVTDFTVSTCNIKNPLITGISGNINVEINYNSEQNLSESGITTANIQPAKFSDGTKIDLLDANKKTTMDQNGYVFTLKLPVPQAAGNKLKIWFPDYLTNFQFDTSSSTYTSQNFSKVSPNIFWEGVLQNAVTDTLSIQFKGYNPPLSFSSYKFTVEMYDSGGYIQLNKIIDYSTSQYTPRNFLLKEVTRLQAENAALTTYTFKVQLDYFLEQNFFLRVEIHNSQTVQNLIVVENSKNLNALTSTLTADGQSQYIDVSSTLVSTFTNRDDLFSEFVFEIKSVSNYRSTWQIQLLLATGKSATMLGSQSTYSFSNNYPKPLNENSIQLLPLKNKNFGEESEYEFNFNLDIGIPYMGRFDINTPNDLPDTVTVFNSASIFNSSKIETRKLRVTCIVQACKTFSFSIRNLINPTYDQFSSFNQLVIQSIKTYDNAVGTDYIMQQVELTSLYYQNSCYPSKPFKNFCKDCNSQLFCTSCYTNAIFGGQKQDKLDTVNNICVQNCPAGTYESNLQCLKCTNNCKTCTSATICLSCVNNFFLQGETCKTSCDNTYYANIMRECTLCDQTKCLNCSGSADNCTQCQSGKGLITRNSFGYCVNCSQQDGYYDKNDNSGVCGICNAACKKCSKSADQCSQCVDVLNEKPIYINPKLSKCTSDCKLDGFSLLEVGGQLQCGQCTQGQRQCKFCKLQPDICESCDSPLYLFGSKCISKDEITDGYYGNDTTRVVENCPSKCKACVSQTVCTACISNFFFSGGTCLDKCPDDTVSDGTGNCKEDVSARVSNLEEDNRVVPFPMLLASIAFGISIYFSKYEYNPTFVPGCVVGFCSLFEWISWIILIAAASQKQEGMNNAAAVIALLGFLLLYIINIVQFILVKKIVERDTHFMEWLQANEKNKLCYQVIKYSSLFISFKAQRIIFSKYFNQSFFKAKLNSIDLFSSFNKLAIVSVIINSSLIIISSALVTYTFTHQSQGFFLGIDSLIVTILMIMFMIWDSLKKKDFFEEPVNQFDQTFIQRFFPFDQSYMEKIQNRSLESHRFHRNESNSSLADFRENKKFTNHEGQQNPYSQVLDPNEMAPNAKIDQNVLKNSEHGAPYLICDQISETFKPGYKGGKRNFDKRHIAPIFDYSRYNPIQEEDEEFDEENMDLKYRQSQSISQSVFLKQKERLENSKNFRGSQNIKNGFSSENQKYYEEEPIPHKQNTGHTVYYNEAMNSQSIQGQNSMRNSRLTQKEGGISVGVNMNEEEDEENKQLREKIYSKPNIGIDGVVDLQKSQSMRQSSSPLSHKDDLQNSKLMKSEGNARSVKSKKSSSPSKSRSISPQLAKNEDQKSKKTSQSPKKQKSIISDQDDLNLRNSQKTHLSNKSLKNSPNKNGTNNDDNDSSYFDHSVEHERGDSAVPINHIQQKQQIKQKKNDQNQSKNEKNNFNDENRVERIMPNEEDIENSNQKTVQPKYDLVNQTNMKGSQNNERNKVKGLLGIEDEKESPSRKQQNKNKGKSNKVDENEQLDKNIYDSDESIKSAEEAEMNYNEISPSDFNVLNQRYEQDFFALQLQQQIQLQQSLGGQIIAQHPESYRQQHSMQMGSVIQSPNSNAYNQSQKQILSGNIKQLNNTRPPLALSNSNSNVSVGHAKSSKSVGVKKRSNKIKPYGVPKNNPNIIVQNHQVQHQGLMTPTSGSVIGSKGNQYGSFNIQQINGDLQRDNVSPLGSQRQRTGEYNQGNVNNNNYYNQDQSDGFYRSNTQNMQTNSYMRIGSNHQATRMGNVSPSYSNQVITYKVPQSEKNKLKSLERIYLQRLETATNNQSSTKKKKTKNYTSNVTNENYDLDSHSVSSSHQNNFNGYYVGETRQVRDSDNHAPSLLDNRNQLIIADFGDDASYKE